METTRKYKPIIAILYDFDKTLCTRDMQEYTFIPSLEMSPGEFWMETDHLSSAQKMDKILAYMYMMVRKSREKDIPLTREKLVAMGQGIEFFPGVLDWFHRINMYGFDNNVIIEHYIISSGLKEIIEGSGIAREFREIYASEFHYDTADAADWPKLSVNYTGKTQFLFRVNKGILDVSKDAELNRYVKEDSRRIPFRNMIYIGDGITDVPCMKLVKSNGGQSIAVYQGKKREEVMNLLTDDRADLLAPADYSRGKRLERIVQTMILKMAIEDNLINLHQDQLRRINEREKKK